MYSPRMDTWLSKGSRAAKRGAWWITLAAPFCSTWALGGVDLRPIWLEQYKATAPHLEGPSLSYFMDTRSIRNYSSLTGFAFDPGQAPSLRQRYDDMSRDYEMRERYGLNNPGDQQARVGQMQGFGQGVLDDQKNQRIDAQQKKLSDKVTDVYEHNETLKTVGTVVSPAALAAGIYMGKPVKLKITDDTLVGLRTDFRGRNGTLEVESPVAHGMLDFRPDAAPQRELVTSASVDFAQAMNLGQIVDWSQERYLFSVYRELPIWQLNSSFFYGSSSNSIAGSLSKRLTDNLTCAVDKVHALTPYADVPGDEEKVRFVYGIHF